jgi:hypothetical protein
MMVSLQIDVRSLKLTERLPGVQNDSSVMNTQGSLDSPVVNTPGSPLLVYVKQASEEIYKKTSGDE